MDLLESVAAKLHEGWMVYQKSNGREFGPERNEKTHPHMLSWEKLSETGCEIETLNQDRFQAALILDAYRQKKITRESLPEFIHSSWVTWEELHHVSGKALHKHAYSYRFVHIDGAQEHEVQATLVWDLITQNLQEA